MPTNYLRDEDEQLRTLISELSNEQRKHYYGLFVAQVKDPDTFAALNWACLAGLHHFYLGRWQRGAFNLILMFIGALFCFIQYAPLFGGGIILFVFIIELPQLFNSQKIIHQYNNQLMKSLLKQIK